MSALKNVVLAVQAAEGRVFRFVRPVSRDAGLAAAARGHLASAGLAERADIRAADLSHGERRQLEFAIALALRPRVFLLDEPMAGLGPEGPKRLTGFLGTLRREAPILLIEHDMEAVFALADRISVLVYGRIIATGTVEEIRSNPEVRSAYLGDEAA
jgi:branched-chain amino acid transport system ATP-binding protein